MKGFEVSKPFVFYDSCISSISGGSFFFLNQFLGSSCFLYLVKSFFPTSNPPVQKTTSISIKLIVEAITFVLVGRSNKGIIKVAAKNTPENIIRNMPSLICQFFVFFILLFTEVNLQSLLLF